MTSQTNTSLGFGVGSAPLDRLVFAYHETVNTRLNGHRSGERQNKRNSRQRPDPLPESRLKKFGQFSRFNEELLA